MSDTAVPEQASGQTDAPVAEPKYSDEIEKFRKELIDIASRTETLAWEHAIKVHYAVEQLAKEFAGLTKAQFYVDLSKGHKWGPRTIKKAGITVKGLWDMGLEEVAVQPASGYYQIAEIISCGLDQDGKGALAREVYKHDKKHPESPFTVEQVKAMIKERMPVNEDDPDWLRPTDFWEFDDCDPRFGRDGGIGRIPGQAIQNIIRRFGGGGGLRVASVMCGTGTVLDVCAKDMKQAVVDYRGIDIAEHPSIREAHGDKFVLGDVTNGAAWDAFCPPDWPDIMIVTPPAFRFTANALTSQKTDLGNINQPEEYLAALEVVLGMAAARTKYRGLIAVFVRHMGAYEDGTPVPNAVRAVTEVLEQVCTEFVASPVMRVVKQAPPGSEPDKNWVQPEVFHVLIYRK
jgi:hypothetical protein